MARAVPGAAGRGTAGITAKAEAEAEAPPPASAARARAAREGAGIRRGGRPHPFFAAIGDGKVVDGKDGEGELR